MTVEVLGPVPVDLQLRMLPLQVMTEDGIDLEAVDGVNGNARLQQGGRDVSGALKNCLGHAAGQRPRGQRKRNHLPGAG